MARQKNTDFRQLCECDQLEALGQPTRRGDDWRAGFTRWAFGSLRGRSVRGRWQRLTLPGVRGRPARPVPSDALALCAAAIRHWHEAGITTPAALTRHLTGEQPSAPLRRAFAAVQQDLQRWSPAAYHTELVQSLARRLAKATPGSGTTAQVARQYRAAMTHLPAAQLPDLARRIRSLVLGRSAAALAKAERREAQAEVLRRELLEILRTEPDLQRRRAAFRRAHRRWQGVVLPDAVRVDVYDLALRKWILDLARQIRAVSWLRRRCLTAARRSGLSLEDALYLFARGTGVQPPGLA